MRKTVVIFVLFAALSCQTAPEGTVAFVNVNVLPMDGERVLEGQTVVASLGLVAEMGAFGGGQRPEGSGGR